MICYNAADIRAVWKVRGYDSRYVGMILDLYHDSRARFEWSTFRIPGASQVPRNLESPETVRVAYTSHNAAILRVHFLETPISWTGNTREPSISRKWKVESQ
jgi:hypothetical protein